MIKLNRKQELALINLGLQSLVDGLSPKQITRKSKQWSKEQHKKFAASMARKWTNKRKPKTK